MNKNILIAEDDNNLRESLVDFLESDEVRVQTASSREEALAIIENAEDLTVVVTDLRMPDFGDGEDVARTAQEKGIQVIVLSGTLSDLNETVRNKCLGVLDKTTFSPKKLSDLIDSL